MKLSVAASGRRVRQIVVDDRQRTNPFAGGGKYRVRHRGSDWRSCRLARAAPDLAAARHQVHVDLWRLRQPYHPIGIKISLHRNAVLDRDLSEQGSSQAKDDAALCLF